MNVDDIVVRLRSITWIGSDALCRDAANEIEELRKERDDARREVCELTMPCLGSQKGYAKGRGWNCFNEEDDNA